MYDIIGFFKELFGLGKAGIEYQSKKLDLKNTAKMEAAKEAEIEAAATDKTREAIAKGDLEDIRKELSE